MEKQMNVMAASRRQAGDWSCRSCQYVNFCKRDACQRCGEAKLGVERTDYAALGGDWDVKPGDWYCNRCSVNNYASRGSCFKCGAGKNESQAAVAQGWGYTVAGQPGMKPGDWICPRVASCTYVQTGLPCAELRQPNRVLPVQHAQIILRLMHGPDTYMYTLMRKPKKQ